MEDVKTGRATRVLWMVASVLLLVVWLASMSLDDDRLCSSVPLCLGFAAVLVLAVAAMVTGGRPPRLTLTALFGVAAGGYFLIRCVAGDMLSEIWRELPLILAGFVFYGAGYLMAQRRGWQALGCALVLGVVVNVAFYYLLQEPSVPVEVKGRPAMSLAGPNGKGTALFGYENFAAMFLLMAGFVLICRPIWAGWKGWRSLALLLVGGMGMACACQFGSRAFLGLVPLMMVSAWVLWAIIRLYSREGGGPGLVLSGIVLFVGIGVFLGELFMGNSLLGKIVSVDTHERTLIWQHIYDLLPQVPWYGHGAGATQWQLLPVIRHWAMPNYAHNDFLQAWVDYGIVGVALLLAVLLGHLTAGFWSLASEEVGRERRSLVASCMLLLLALSACAVFDFVWHNVALAGLSAFACGVLASPVPSRQEPFFSRRRWAAGSGPSLRPVRPVGRTVAALCCMGCLTLAFVCVCFGWRLLPAWEAQWEYNALCHAGAGDGERAAFLEKVMDDYPDPELVDYYVTLRIPGERDELLARKEKMLRRALEANPHQMFTVVMLADVLGRAERCAEAEALMRDNYLPDGQSGTAIANWPGYYGLNLLKWGHQRMRQGDRASALSMMEYALNIWGHANKFRYNSACARGVEQVRNKAADALIAARRMDVELLRSIGVEKDDSWQQPMRPGGVSALYARWGNKPHEAR